MRLIAQGAEAKIYKSRDKIVKDRIKKSYRLPVIDSRLRNLRTKAEARLISQAARDGIPVPRVIDVGKTKLEIEFLKGLKLRDWIDSQQDLEAIKKVMRELGELTAKMHSANVIHGDLTTSNIIYLDKPYFIDFGLGTFSERLEDKAVDLHLFKECLKSKHYEHWLACWTAFKEGYKDTSEQATSTPHQAASSQREQQDSSQMRHASSKTFQGEQVFEQLDRVESRGRYKKRI